MKQFSKAFSDIGEVHAFLAQTPVRDAMRHAKSVLVQVYNQDEDTDWITQVVDAFRTVRENAVIVGALTFGQISEGRVPDTRTTASVSCFDTAELSLIEQSCEPGQETEAARSLVGALGKRINDAKGVLLLSTPLTINCDLLLSAIHEISPGLPVFGGGSADISLQKMMVFSQRGMHRSGLVAVALCGGSLEIMRSVHLGWLPIGQKMVVTKAEGAVVETIDHHPAIEIYKRYLGITSDERFFLNVMEFPLLVERHGELHARVPYESGEGGSIRFTAELKEGEEVHFGYARIGQIQQQVEDLERSVRRFGPEAVHIYSCIIRHFVLQRDIDLEISPFERLAPTAGFFTAGEFCGLPDSSVQRNAVMVVVAMREAPAPCTKILEPRAAFVPEASNLYEDNHMRILLRYQHFMQAITEDLEAANEELASLAERDALTGLFNRRKMSSVMQAELERSTRYGNLFSIILCDIDHFKQFNDHYGHQAGDVVLKNLARVFQDEARAPDVVCRFGGEEFVIVMPETHANDAVEFADRIRRIVAAQRIRHLDAPLPSTTMSFGVAGFPRNGRNTDELISAADAALYEAKRQGRNQVCLSEREAGEAG